MLKKDLQNDLNKAVKENNEVSRSTLRMLLATVSNKEKEKKYKKKEEELTEEELMEIVSSEAKKRREAIKEFERGERSDLADREKAELKVLENYLPEQLSYDEIKELVEKAITKTGASEIKDMGKVMAELMPDVKGKADGGEVSRIVKELLSNDRD